MKGRKLIGICIFSLALVLLLTLVPACGKGQEGEVKTLKIGILQALSGPVAVWGTGFETGTKWAAENVNAAGGIKVGDDTYMIETVSCDCKEVGSEAAACATRFVDEGIHYVVGPILMSDAVEPIFKQAKTFYATQGTHPASPDMPYRIIATANGPAWVRTWYDMATARHPEFKTIAVINPGYSTGPQWQEASLEAAAAHGLTVVAEGSDQAGITDYYPILTPIIAKNPDVIDFSSAAPGEVALMTKQARELGFEGWLWHPAMTTTKFLIDTAGAENVWKIASNEPDWTSPVYPARAQQLNEEYLEKFAQPGQKMDRLAPMSYSAVLMFAKAIEEAGSIDPDEVMKVFNDPNFRFDAFFADDVALGGIETFGIRRQWPLNNDYGEIIDVNNISLSIDMTLATAP